MIWYIWCALPDSNNCLAWSKRWYYHGSCQLQIYTLVSLVSHHDIYSSLVPECNNSELSDILNPCHELSPSSTINYQLYDKHHLFQNKCLHLTPSHLQTPAKGTETGDPLSHLCRFGHRNGFGRKPQRPRVWVKSGEVVEDPNGMDLRFKGGNGVRSWRRCGNSLLHSLIAWYTWSVHKHWSKCDAMLFCTKTSYSSICLHEC